MTSPVFAYFYMPGVFELAIIALIVLLLFGSRLPSVMGNLGKSIVEFKKGVKGIERDDNETGQTTSDSRPRDEHT